MSTSPSLLQVRRPSASPASPSQFLSTTIVPSTVIAKPSFSLCVSEQEDEVEVVLNASASSLSMSDPAESALSINSADFDASLSSSPQSTASASSTDPSEAPSASSSTLSRFNSRSAFKSFFIEALTGVTGVATSVGPAFENQLPEGVVGYALAKESWTPDADALSCFHPSCPVTFSALSLSNRRHHCRMCGQIYCAAHTARSCPLLLPSGAVRTERTCQSCISEKTTSHAAQITSAGSSAVSLTELAHDSDFQLSIRSNTKPHVTRAAFRPSFNRSNSNPDSRPSRAPIQPWMDGQGVLSLYPLATKRSHRALSPNEPTAAAPLFALSASQVAKKHKSRCAAPEFVPANWGYRREAFDESYESEDSSEDEADDELEKGGLVVNGPFMLRAHPERFIKKMSAPPALAAGVTKQYAGDWSTF